MSFGFDGSANAVSSAVFGLIQGPVGGFDQLARHGFRHGDGGGDAEAGGDMAEGRGEVGEAGLFDVVPDSLGDEVGSAERSLDRKSVV